MAELAKTNVDLIITVLHIYTLSNQFNWFSPVAVMEVWKQPKEADVTFPELQTFCGRESRLISELESLCLVYSIPLPEGIEMNLHFPKHQHEEGLLCRGSLPLKVIGNVNYSEVLQALITVG